MENPDSASSLCPAAEETHDSDSSPSLAAADAASATNPGAAAAAGARKRKAPGTAAAARKPRKTQAEEPIQMPVYYGLFQDFSIVHGEDLVDDCEISSYREIKCAHLTGELPLQPQTMSLLDLQLWIIRLFRLHPETQDLAVKAFHKQHTADSYDEEGPEWFLQEYSWETRHFYDDKCWSSFANKLKKKRNVTQRFMLYVDSSEIRHWDILRKALNDDYSQLETVVFPGMKSLASSRFGFRCLVENTAMTSEELVAYLTHHLGEQISPIEAWRARQYALERQYGTFYDSYNLAPMLLKEIKRKNPGGGFLDIKDAEIAGCKHFRVLHRMFWAFGQCLQAFQNCRPVLCIKGMPLCGKYKGVLVTAVALDANGFTIPVAFAIIEGETRESWLWFLRNLERAVVHRSDICIIHDYKSELINAVEDLLRSHERKWRSAESRWCMEHLAENFVSYFGDTKLVTMFKKLCQQKRRLKFGKIWKELDELTSKYMAEKEGCASGETQQETVKHDEAEPEVQRPCNLPDSVADKEAGHSKGRKRKITNFSDWIGLKPKEKWSLSHDKEGARYGIMGTDMADLYKNDPILRGITCLPLSAIVEVTFLRMVDYFKKMSAAANKAIGNPLMNFSERVQDDMKSKMQKAEMHDVTYTYNDDRNVLGGEKARKFTVKSGKKQVTVNLKSEYIHSMNKSEGPKFQKIATCTCNKPQLLHKPCSHVITVCCQIGVDTATYVSPYYCLDYLVNTWKKKFIACRTPRDYKNTIMPSGFETLSWIPDKKLECGLPAFVSSNSVQTAVDEEEQLRLAENGLISDNHGTKIHSEEPSQV